MTDSPGKRWAWRTALTAAVLLGGVLLPGCGKEPQRARTARAVKWNRGIPAGGRASLTDVTVVELPASAVESDEALLTRADLRLFDGDVYVSRAIRKGDLVRRAELVSGRAPGPSSRPGGAGQGGVADWRSLPSGDPATIEAEGKYKRYVTTTMGTEPGMTEPLFPVAETRPAAPAGMPIRRLMETGTHRLGEDVPDVVVPKGARRVYAFRHKTPDGHSDNLTYTAPMAVASAEAFYADRLPKAGYKLIARGPTMRRDGGVMLVFAKDSKHNYLVNLHPVDKGKGAKIVLMIARPEGD